MFITLRLLCVTQSVCQSVPDGQHFSQCCCKPSVRGLCPLLPAYQTQSKVLFALHFTFTWHTVYLTYILRVSTLQGGQQLKGLVQSGLTVHLINSLIRLIVLPAFQYSTLTPSCVHSMLFFSLLLSTIHSKLHRQFNIAWHLLPFKNAMQVLAITQQMQR